MKSVFVIKDIEAQLYYGGDNYGWCDRVRLAETFTDKQEALKIIKNQEYGWYVLEKVYIIDL